MKSLVTPRFNSFEPVTHVLSRTLGMAEIIDDEYVANLLKQDAKTAKTKYELVGIEAFNSKRCVASLFGLLYFQLLR